MVANLLWKMKKKGDKETREKKAVLLGGRAGRTDTLTTWKASKHWVLVLVLVSGLGAAEGRAQARNLDGQVWVGFDFGRAGVVTNRPREQIKACLVPGTTRGRQIQTRGRKVQRHTQTHLSPPHTWLQKIHTQLLS